MFIIGSDKLFKEKIFLCRNKEDIKKYTDKNIIIEDIELARFCYDEKIAYLALNDNLIDMMYFGNLKAKYIASNKLDFVKTMQELANEYLMDSKIALIVKKEKDIMQAINAKIDGVILHSCIKNP